LTARAVCPPDPRLPPDRHTRVLAARAPQAQGSLLGKQGYSLAEIAERLGDAKVVTAEHYMYAIGDYGEVDYAAVLSR
jgi:hypothetical protein